MFFNGNTAKPLQTSDDGTSRMTKKSKLKRDIENRIFNTQFKSYRVLATKCVEMDSH